MKRFLYILLIVLSVSCEKKLMFEYPIIYTGEVTDITKEKATFHAKITNYVNNNTERTLKFLVISQPTTKYDRNEINK